MIVRSLAGVSYEIDKAALTALVAPHVQGPVDVRLVFEPAAQRHRGFAFVNCDTTADAQAVIDAMNSKEIKGRMMTATFARVPAGGGQKSGARGGGRNRERNGRSPTRATGRDRSVSPPRSRGSDRDYDRRDRPSRLDRTDERYARDYPPRYNDRYDYPPRRSDRYDDSRYDRDRYERPRGYYRDPRDYDPRPAYSARPAYDDDRYSPEPRYRGRERSSAGGPRSPPRAARAAYDAPRSPRSRSRSPAPRLPRSRSRSPHPRSPATTSRTAL